MKIILLGPTYPMRGGIARYGTNLYKALRNRHNCVGIGFKKLYPSFLFPGAGELETASLADDEIAAEPLLHYAHPSSWLKALDRIVDFSPTAVVLTWWVPFWAPHLGWLSRRLSRRTHVLFLCHNVVPHEPKFYDTALVRWALGPGKGFMVHSEEDRKTLVNWFPKAAIVKRGHPLYEGSAACLMDQEEARRLLGIKNRMLLFFGFVRPY
ncbi:MAG: glycosyl transferase family 1, partial [bacterium]